MSDSVKRLREFMDDKALTSKSLASKIGVQASTFSHYFNGRNSPSAKVMDKLLSAYPELNADWLLRGVGPKYHANASVAKNETSLFPDDDRNVFQRAENAANQSAAADTSLFRHAGGGISDAGAMTVKNGEEPHTIIKEVVKQIPSKIITRIVVYYSDNTYEDFLAR